MKDACIDRTVAVCEKVVSSFSFSWKRRRDLATAQQELNLPEHQLISESPTKWGSREKMIERVLEQEQAISQVLAADKKTLASPSHLARSGSPRVSAQGSQTPPGIH